MSPAPTDARVLEGDIDHDGGHVFRHYLTPSSQTDVVKLRVRLPDCVPVYPVRYGVIDASKARPLPATLNTSDCPALGNDKHWGLRVLRPRSFVYLLYTDKDSGEFVIQGFQVTQDVRFRPLSAEEIQNVADDEENASSAAPEVINAEPPAAGRQVNGLTLSDTGVLPYIPAPNAERADSVELLIADTILTEQRCQALEADRIALSAPWNETIASWRDAIATAMKPHGDDQQTHTFDARQLARVVPEMAPSQPLRRRPRAWSESQPDAPSGESTPNAMSRVVAPAEGRPNLAVAVHDPVGALSELSHQLGIEMTRLSELADDAVYKVFASKAIDALVEQAATDAADRVADTSFTRSNMGITAEQVREERAADARQARLAYVADDAQRRAFVRDLDEKKQQRVAAIEARSQDGWHVFDAIKQRYQAAVALNDVATVAGFEDCQTIAAQTLPVLTQCEDGLTYLQEHMSDTGPTGLPGWLMAGHPDVAGYLAQSASVAVAGSASVSGEAAGHLEKLLKRFPPRDASRMLSLMMAGLETRDMRAPYRRLMALWEGKLIESESMTRGEMLEFVKRQHNAHGVGPFRPQQARSLDGFRPRTNAKQLYEMQTIKDVEVRSDRAAEARLANRERFWRNVHVGFSGVVLVVSAWNAEKSFEALGREDGLTFTNALSAADGTFATGSAGAALGNAANKAAELAARRAGDNALADARNLLADKCATFMIGLGSAAAVVAAVQRGTDASRADRTASALYSTAGAIEAVAGVTGFYAVFSSSVGGALRVALPRLGLGFAGWILFAATALDLLFSYAAELAARNQDLNEWIARSIWGNGKDTDRPPFPDINTAIKAYFQLVAPPQIEAGRDWGNTLQNTVLPKPWEKPAQFTKVQLPNWQASTGYYSITNRPGRFDVFEAQHFSNIPAELEQGATELTVDTEGKVGSVQFESMETGTAEVRYWPYGATDDSFVLTASND